jgi:hypothetical protein
MNWRSSANFEEGGHPTDQKLIRIPTGIELNEFAKAAREERAAGQQDERKRNLADNQRVAKKILRTIRGRSA